MLTTAMISGHMLFQEKNKYSRDGRHAGKSHGGGGGLMALQIRMGGGL